MNIQPLDKLTLYLPFGEIKRGRVVGMKEEKDQSTTYMIAPLGVGFRGLKSDINIIRLNSKDIDNNSINIKIHEYDRIYRKSNQDARTTKKVF